MIDNPQQILAVMTRHMCEEINDDEAKRLVGYSTPNDNQTVFLLYDYAIQHKDVALLKATGNLIRICDGWSEDQLLYYCNILVAEDWHDEQEDDALELGAIRDPSSIPYLVKAANMRLPEESSLHSGRNKVFHRKCLYALARIGTDQADKEILILRNHEFEDVRIAAEEVIALFKIEPR
jgi:hypothetical protein